MPGLTKALGRMKNPLGGGFQHSPASKMSFSKPYLSSMSLDSVSALCFCTKLHQTGASSCICSLHFPMVATGSSLSGVLQPLMVQNCQNFGCKNISLSAEVAFEKSYPVRASAFAPFKGERTLAGAVCFKSTSKSDAKLRRAVHNVPLEAESSDSLVASISEEKADAQDKVALSIEADKSVPKSDKRRRGQTNIQEEPDLLSVPGIGPRNMEKLVAKGIAKLVELKQLYRDKFRSNGSEKMVEFLQSSVGVHKNHATRIASFIKTTVDEELKAEDTNKEQNPLITRKRLTFCVEGNISVGKTTFLQKIANETIELRDLVEVVPEPIRKWQDIGKDHFNILDAFYAEPERYAYTFQNYVFVTRLMQERESANGLKPLRLMERSVFSDRMVFVRAVHEAKWMNEMEISIYDSWFDPVVSELPGLVPDGFIYLRASPDTCHRRLQMRKRKEEQSVSLDYLQGLHEKHEQWLFPAEKRSPDVLSVTKWPLGPHDPPPGIKDRVFYLEGDNVHTCIRKVPALVLDCEATIDFSKDNEAKAEYARQVAEFFEYVKRTKETELLNSNGAMDRLLRPRPRGLVGPDGSPLDTEMNRRSVSNLYTCL